MNNTLIIAVPESLEKFLPLLEQFIEGMLFKLHKNSYKDTPTIKTVPEIIDFMQLEIDEFELQFFEDKKDINALYELCDIANFAFLAHAALSLEKANASDVNAG